jgi:predicted porin
MQKKLIALAVAGLVSGAAFAQSSVVISGVVDIGYGIGKDEATEASGAKSSRKFTNMRGAEGTGASSSRLNLLATEDLGNGLKAGFNHEFGLINMNANSGNGSVTTDSASGARQTAFGTTRQSFLFLETKNVGKFYVGYQELIADQSTGFANGSRNHYGNAYNATFSLRPAGSATAALMSTTAGVGTGVSTSVNGLSVGAGDLGRANTVRYDSPVFAGFTAMVQAGYSKNTDSATSAAGVSESAAEPSSKIFEAGLKYANGPMTGYVGYQKWTQEANTVAAAAATTGTKGEEDRRQYIAAGAYDFGVAKLVGMYFDRKGTADFTSTVAATTGSANTTAKYRGGDIGVKVPVQNFEFFGNYGFAKATVDTTIVGTPWAGSGTIAAPAAIDADWKVRTYQLGTVYNLSKRTNVYAIYGVNKLTSGDDGNAKRSIVTAGMRHSF